VSIAFEAASAGKIVFGEGSAARLGELVRGLVREGTLLLVTGRDATRRATQREVLVAAGFDVVSLACAGEPTTDAAREGTALARERRVVAVVAIGGGSALDLGKAIAVLATHPGDPLDYLEVVGRGIPLTERSLPFVAVPTTAGTGSEVTKNAVLADRDTRVKVSLRSDTMLPRIALVDPRLTHDVPPDVTAATGLDAITQVIEPFVSHAATPFTDALAREAIPRGARAIRRVFADGSDADARSDMALTSLFGGLCLANGKLGAVHGFAGPIGGAFETDRGAPPHGAVCARLLPLVLEANVRALRAAGSPIVTRFDELGRMLTGDPTAGADRAVGWAHDVARDLAIPGLGTYGMTRGDLVTIAERSERASSMKGNPIELPRNELVAILERAL
jgi:alcohol dehydrogenase class IV